MKQRTLTSAILEAETRAFEIDGPVYVSLVTHELSLDRPPGGMCWRVMPDGTRLRMGADRPPEGFVIESLTAFIAVDNVDHSEGIVARGNMPLIGADETRLRELRPFAQNTADESGTEIKLVQFSSREELETIKPRPKT